MSRLSSTGRKRGSVSRRPRFVLGPGLFLAILASVAVWAFLPRDRQGPPKVVHETQGTISRAPTTPDPGWLVGQAGALRLTPAQAQRMAALNARWDRDTRTLRADLDAASGAFSQRMAAESGRRVAVPDVRQGAESVSALTGQLLAARRAWWDEARTVLTPVQGERAERLWAERLSGKQGTEQR